MLGTLFFFVLVLAVCVYGFSAAGRRSDAESLAAVERNIRRAVVECYALEGMYPKSLAYIESHYGVQVDGSDFYVHYQYNGQNIMPEVAVMAAE